jgi:glycosyltransferase involved in cell wall biosynthesis
MACEIPVIMSAVGVNTEIIQQGENGFLAKTENDWLTNLSNLIENEVLRKQLGKKGRETVVEHYSVRRYTNVYLKLFENAQSSR